MFQNGTNWMDGTAGGSFTYNFTVPNQHGTYWWHSHSTSQYADGIVGPLIIQSPDEGIPIDYDEDIIVMMTDWYHIMSTINVATYLTAAGPDGQAEGSEPVPDNGLINGLNVFDCSGATNTSVPCTGGSYATFNVTANKKYRLRLINTGAFADFDFSIDNHTLTVVEADGIAMEPVNVTRIPLAVAQRYSIIAIFRYDGADSSSNPTTIDNNLASPALCSDLNQTMLVPVEALEAPEPDVTYYLEVSFQSFNPSLPLLGYMNTTTWTPLSNSTTLIEAQAGNVNNFGAQQFVVTPPSNASVIEIIIQNYDEGPHPFHFHGHVFWVLGVGQGYVYSSFPTFNTTNPLRRDTVIIPAYGWAVLRLVPHPGMWIFHCHIVWHMAAGLAMQWQFGSDVVANYQIPQAVLDLFLYSVYNSMHPDIIGTQFIREL
ncbi:hypothetical protein BZG36_03532 [Bifiguratus adelaidae]|uniref:Multicopper oxidase n=1 Tax=Bifiguratus adelaidae TaxID=1938954 RepID=A0A261XZ84_9FUNG|nr:hypothetical protein BZG36_03532 [Bifiguratus adelaidae]